MFVADEILLAKSAKMMPITDGLLFWLDCRDTLYGDPTDAISYNGNMAYKSATMYDRVSNLPITIKRTYGTNLYVQQDSPFLSIISASEITSSDRLYINASENIDNIMSCEIVVNGNIKSFQAMANFAVIASMSNGNMRCSSAIVTSSKIITEGSVHFFCKNGKNPKYQAEQEANIYQNGLLVSTRYGTPSLITPASGNKLFNAQNVGKLGCIRLYNRTLTDEEIQHNIQYEIEVGRMAV